ncbi:sulfatase family protein [Portibacter lacus]|uniref:Arylsulfatase n=1 Tax=Portibacter lacus TaxID=1099794 RepID=A0AA37WFY0_9BACT|nr:arylsulfatase [Portibacter lacus]GLR19227.1 arylsulfatase [Portibacter lacus]
MINFAAILNFRTSYFLGLIAILLCSAGCNDKNASTAKKENRKPNIVIIYADDLGYGDVGAYGSTVLKTPNMDMLANGGMRFTNGYASSATCSPSRYALLTGSYPWRNKNAKILPGTAPLLISTDQMTIPKMLKTQGYHTGIVGKWHIGLGDGKVDWNSHISPGPKEVGFDYSYIMAATQDRVPTVYIENGDVVRLDPNDPIEISYKENFPGERTGKEDRDQLKMDWHHGHNNSVVNGIPRIGFMKGGEKAKWVDENMADTFLVRSQNYVKAHKDEPFFLYYALQQPHVPRTPHPRFVGKSGLGPRGDVIVEADWCIGEFIKTLKEEGLLENTLVILSSDNGPVLNDGYYDDAVEKNGEHTPSGKLRGGKYSLFEAGTRLPFITYFEGTIKPGVSNALVSQIDLLTSLAKLVGSDITTPDSQDFMDVFLGKSNKSRKNLVLEATSRVAFRKGNYVMIPPHNGAAKIKSVNIEIGNDPEFQLYDLSTDLGQQNNIASEKPEILEGLKMEFAEITKGADLKETRLILK